MRTLITIALLAATSLSARQLTEAEPTSTLTPMQAWVAASAARTSLEAAGVPCAVIATKGTSMRPHFAEACYVLVETAVQPATLQVGDVVLFSTESGSVLHVVFKRVKGGVWTRGYNNAMPDRCLVDGKNLKGRVIAAFNMKQGEP